MHVGFNARNLCDPSRRGFNRYTYNLARALSRIEGVRISLITDQPLDHSFLQDLNAKVVLEPSARHLWWEQHVVPRVIGDLKLDVFHAPATLGLPLRKACAYVLTIHDTIGEAAPQFVPAASIVARIQYRARRRISLSRADALITGSEHSKGDIVRHLRVPSDRVIVIPDGVEEKFRVMGSTTAVSAVMARYGLLDRYILYVGGFDARKNVIALIEAYAGSRAGKEADLVLVGARTPETVDLTRRARALGVDRRTKFLGYVPDEDLPALYNGAAVFVYASLYEGFGLQLAEAMACGTPIVASNRTSLPEVLNGAGWLVDPEDSADIASAIDAIFFDQHTAATLTQRGLRVAENLSWARTARQTLDVYQAVSGPRGKA